jgi:hypothetical protein
MLYFLQCNKDKICVRIKTPASKAPRWRPSPNHRLVRVGFVVGKATVGQIYLEVLYVFFWVIPRRLNFISRRYGTLYLFHLHRQEGISSCL